MGNKRTRHTQQVAPHACHFGRVLLLRTHGVLLTKPSHQVAVPRPPCSNETLACVDSARPLATRTVQRPPPRDQARSCLRAAVSTPLDFLFGRHVLEPARHTAQPGRAASNGFSLRPPRPPAGSLQATSTNKQHKDSCNTQRQLGRGGATVMYCNSTAHPPQRHQIPTSPQPHRLFAKTSSICRHQQMNLNA